MKNQGEFYIYSFNDPRTNAPYYIGKGQNQRWYDHFASHYFKNPKNPYKARKIKKLQRLGYEPEKHVNFLATGLSEELAYELEEFVISEIGLANLTNLTLGGTGGIKGMSFPQSGRDKLSEAFKGEKHPRAKLTEQKAAEIKWLTKFSNWSCQKISNIVGQLSAGSVRDIKKSYSWKHVEPQKPDWFDGPLKYNGYKSEAEMIEAMRARYNMGFSLPEIGKEFNLTPVTVKYKCFPGQKLSNDLSNDLTEREAGEIKWLTRHSAMYKTKIAEIYSTSHLTVDGLMRKNVRKQVNEQKPSWFCGTLRFRGYNNAQEMMQAVKQDFYNGFSERQLMNKYDFGLHKVRNLLNDNPGYTK